MAHITISLEIADTKIAAMLLGLPTSMPPKVSMRSIQKADKAAPWGRKKDGTPKKRPGRKARKVQ